MIQTLSHSVFSSLSEQQCHSYLDGSFGSHHDGVVGQQEAGGAGENCQAVPGEPQVDHNSFIHSCNSRYQTLFHASVKGLVGKKFKRRI